MGFKTTVEQQNTAGPQDPEARRMLQLMAGTAEDAAGQMGDLSSIAGGEIQMTPWLQEQLSRLQQIAGAQGRQQMERNLASTTRQVEDTAIGQNMTGGTFEAIQQALAGQAHQDALNQQALQQEAQTVEAGINMPLQYGQLQLQGNQALLQRLVQGAGSNINYDAQMRQLNSSMVQDTTVPLTQMAMQGAQQIGQTMLTPTGGVTKA